MSELEHDEQEQIKQRREKLNAIREEGIAFPTDFRRNVVAGELLAEYGEKSEEELLAEPIRVKIAGRMMTRRIMGKASFCHLQDMSGQIQVYVARDNLAEGVYNDQFKKWDIGDILGAEGVLFKTKVGELSVKVDDIRLLTKALRPLPEKFHGIADQEIKYRQRYLDLIMSNEARHTFVTRSKIVNYIRDFLVQRDFLEVETPMMQVIPGGATARPFKTFHNALDMELYLRIAPELYLKRLVVDGFERVFEINRNFRNEGLSTRHNPEFTMMEFYAAWWNHHDLMDFTEAILRHAAIAAVGTAKVTYGEKEVDLESPFARMTVREALIKMAGLTEAEADSAEVLHSKLKQLGEEPPARWNLAELQFGMFEAAVEEKLWQPTFIIDYPVEVSPLARASDTTPSITERFELFITGREYGNGFSELNDPEEQAARFAAQASAKDAGDEEAMYFDADYIRALEYGLPPTGGCGIGIDRLMMLLTDAPNIRDVILFPALRRES